MKEISYEQFLHELKNTAFLSSYPKSILNTVDPDPLHVVARHNKYTIVQSVPQESINVIREKENNTVSINTNDDIEDGVFIAYPKDVLAFEAFALSETRNGGPNYMFPGSIALLEYRLSKEESMLEIEYIQFSFTQGSPKWLTRSTASKYMGARNRLVHTTLEYGLDNDAFIVKKGYKVQVGKQNNKTIDTLLNNEQFAQLQRVE